MPCTHENFRATVEVNRIQDEGDDRPRAYDAAITITCDVCGVPMQFIGVPDMGLLGDRPTVSPDLLELRVPLAPKGETVPGLGTGFTIRMHAAEATET